MNKKKKDVEEYFHRKVKTPQWGVFVLSLDENILDSRMIIGNTTYVAVIAFERRGHKIERRKKK